MPLLRDTMPAQKAWAGRVYTDITQAYNFCGGIGGHVGTRQRRLEALYRGGLPICKLQPPHERTCSAVQGSIPWVTPRLSRATPDTSPTGSVDTLNSDLQATHHSSLFTHSELGTTHRPRGRKRNDRSTHRTYHAGSATTGSTTPDGTDYLQHTAVHRGIPHGDWATLN